MNICLYNVKNNKCKIKSTVLLIFNQIYQFRTLFGYECEFP